MPVSKTCFSDSVSSRVSRLLRKATSKKFSAFTLVELIVVITILAILATIGFLALSGYSQDAKDASVKANVRSVMTAISAESALTNNSPRHYVVHNTGAALADGTVAYVDGSPVTLTGGAFGTAGTNYSAGNPDWAKLKLNPEKFKLSALPTWVQQAFAAYDPKAVAVGALDAALAPAANGRARSTSYFQVTGVAPATDLASVAGNFPQPTPAQTASGAVAGLVKNPASSSLTGALVEGAKSSSAEPAGAACALPWGGTLPSGQAVTAFQTATVPYMDGPCVSQNRACSAGTLSGTYVHPTCKMECLVYQFSYNGYCADLCPDGYGPDESRTCVPTVQYDPTRQYVYGDRFKVGIAEVEVTESTGPFSGIGQALDNEPRQSGCDNPDVAVWNGSSVQLWSACNVGATAAYHTQQTVTLANVTVTGGPTAAQKEYMGAYYQWGRNKDVTTGTVTTGPLPSDTASDFIKNALGGVAPGANYDWLTDANRNDNLWGGQGTGTGAGTYPTQGNPAAMQGPCQSGYHVPTQKEWCDAIIAVSPTRSGGAAMTCEASWQVEATANKFRDTLRLPLAGLRNASSAAFNYQGTYGLYWASSPSGQYGYGVNLSSTLGVYPANVNNRAVGLSVRCLKN